MPRVLPFVIGVFVAMPAFADGFYLAADLGMASYNDTVRADGTDFGNGIPDELTMNGQPFDSKETAWGIAFGWQARDWFAVELAYTDLGNSGQDSSAAFFGPLIVPDDAMFLPNPPPVPFDPNVFVTTRLPVFPGRAALEAEAWSVSAKFSKHLVNRLSANWMIGLTHTDYSAQGAFPFTDVDSTVFPFDVTIVQVPYAAPDAETGLVWGLGFGWQTTASTSVELGYRQHKTDVIDIDTTSLRFLFAF